MSDLWTIGIKGHKQLFPNASNIGEKNFFFSLSLYLHWKSFLLFFSMRYMMKFVSIFYIKEKYSSL